MSRTLTASDRSSLIRLASAMPAGSAERKAILAGLSRLSWSESIKKASGEFSIPGNRAKGSAFYVRGASDGGGITSDEAAKLISRTAKALADAGFKPTRLYGELDAWLEDRVDPKKTRFSASGDYTGPAPIEDLEKTLKEIGWNPAGMVSHEYKFQYKGGRGVELTVLPSVSVGKYNIYFESMNSALKLGPEEETKILNDFAAKVGNVLKELGSETSGGSKLSGGKKATSPDEHIVFSLGKSDLPTGQVLYSKTRLGEDIRKKLRLELSDSGTFHYLLYKYIDVLHKWVYVAVVYKPVYVGQQEYFSADITVYMSGYTKPKLR